MKTLSINLPEVTWNFKNILGSIIRISISALKTVSGLFEHKVSWFGSIGKSEANGLDY